MASPTSVGAPPSPSPASTDGPPVEPALASPPWDFTFGDVDGLVAVDAPHSCDDSVNEQVTTVWSTGRGITDGYLTLRVVSAGAPTPPQGEVTATRIEAPTGEAWLVTDIVADDPPPTSATHIEWWRDDGRVWIVSNHGLTAQELTELAFRITAEPDGSHALPDASMTLVGSVSLEHRKCTTQAWTLDGRNLSLEVANGGLANQVGDHPVLAVAERTIAGRTGYAITLAKDRST